MTDVKEEEKVATSSSHSARKALKPAVAVQVVATRDWDEGVDFRLRWEFPKGVWNSGVMVFAKDEPREVEYTLVDETGLGLVFESPADESIWVTEGPCPKKTKPPHGSDKGQIKDKNLSSDTELKVKNENSMSCNLHYALRFKGREWSRPGKSFGPEYAYDPEYRNGGGGGSNT